VAVLQAVEQPGMDGFPGQEFQGDGAGRRRVAADNGSQPAEVRLAVVARDRSYRQVEFVSNEFGDRP
jgi:hypothetical protein